MCTRELVERLASAFRIRRTKITQMLFSERKLHIKSIDWNDRHRRIHILRSSAVYAHIVHCNCLFFVLPTEHNYKFMAKSHGYRLENVRFVFLFAQIQAFRSKIVMQNTQTHSHIHWLPQRLLEHLCENKTNIFFFSFVLIIRIVWSYQIRSRNIHFTSNRMHWKHELK